MSTSKIRFKLKILQGHGAVLKLRNTNGTINTLVGFVGEMTDGLVAVSSRKNIYAVKIEDIIDCWNAKGKVEP